MLYFVKTETIVLFAGGKIMGNVRRVYVEKKDAYAVAAKELYSEIRGYLNIKDVTGVRVLVRKDCFLRTTC